MKIQQIAWGLVLSIAALNAQDAPEKPKGSAAEQYAGELSKLLSEYQKQISNKVAAEQKGYAAAAKLYDDAFREDVFASLSLDRTADSQHAQRALQTGALSADRLMDDVFSYAQRDFDQTRAVYLMGLDSYKTYLSNLNSLQADSQKISALVKTLNDLATPASLKDRLRDIQAYRETFNKQLHFSDCSMADSLLMINSKKKAAVDARIQALTTQIASGTGDVAALQTAKNAAGLESAALKAKIDELGGQRANSGGFTAGTGGAGKCEVK